MDRAKLEELIRGIIIKNSRIDVRTVEDDQVLARDSGLDSLALVSTLAELEDKLGIKFPMEKLEDAGELTFQGLVELVLEASGGEG
jgi:acyl carrier protein